jgi:hypothetical protein
MKKSLYLAFIAALALSMGCIVTGYPLVTDRTVADGYFVVNTNGKAMINEYSHVATIHPDGYREETFAMIDQKFDGSATITSYAQVGLDSLGSFIGDTYCNPEWNGCAMATAPNGGSLWDYTYNVNCPGIRSVSYLYNYGSVRPGECGRGLGRQNPGLLNAITGSFVDLGDAWGLNLNRSNTRLIGTDSQGHSFDMPLFGNTQLTWAKAGNGWTVNIHNGMLPTARAQARVTDQYDVNKWTIEYLGHSKTFSAKFRPEFAARLAGY